MAPVLAVCTKEERKLVIRFLWYQGVSGAEIHHKLPIQYGYIVLLWRSIRVWIENIENDRAGVKCKEGTKWPSKSTSDVKIQHVREMVLVNRRATIMKWYDFYKLVMILLKKSSTTNIASGKSERDRCQECIPKHISATMWKSVNTHSSVAKMKSKYFWDNYYIWNLSQITFSQKTRVYRIETLGIACRKEKPASRFLQ